MLLGELILVVGAYVIGAGFTAFLFGRYVCEERVGWAPPFWPITLPMLLLYLCWEAGRESK